MKTYVISVDANELKKLEKIHYEYNGKASILDYLILAHSSDKNYTKNAAFIAYEKETIEKNREFMKAKDNFTEYLKPIIAAIPDIGDKPVSGWNVPNFAINEVEIFIE